MVRVEMCKALGNGVVPGCFSTSNEFTPKRDSKIDALNPTGPPPTIRTGTSSVSDMVDSPS